MSCQNNYRELTRIEIETLEQQRGCCAELWLKVKVGSDFSPAQLWRSRFEGEVFVGEGVQILDSTVCNYILDKGVRVESVTRLECRTKSRFGNGVEVAVVNECGGRTVKIYDNLKAQTAYLWAIFRHRATFCSEVERMVEEYSSAKESELGYVGESSVIVGGRFIREVNIGRGVVIEGHRCFATVHYAMGRESGLMSRLKTLLRSKDRVSILGRLLRGALSGRAQS